MPKDRSFFFLGVFCNGLCTPQIGATEGRHSSRFPVTAGLYRQQRALHQANISTEIQLQYSNTILLVVVRTNNIITIEPTLVFY